ncbi:hypothetical protein PF010_g20710 [Phytophthora fragariae]|uniref:Uncharacterized protein n=1 Tax=Phytophthora fragariae TaxID=53985 RepID=A0A6A3IUV7_9STRA|nr:hypothetical protein PF011_g19836 [Phytophthora fragariae]KAE9084758.1 hypothetical protein PF010_g20710 [Phytophthora fragariae]KAE9288170.1 hypothetical protein PF001_g20643 [Phytophthora fragariae]
MCRVSRPLAFVALHVTPAVLLLVAEFAWVVWSRRLPSWARRLQARARICLRRGPPPRVYHHTKHCFANLLFCSRIRGGHTSGRNLRARGFRLAPP